MKLIVTTISLLALTSCIPKGAHNNNAPKSSYEQILTTIKRDCKKAPSRVTSRFFDISKNANFSCDNHVIVEVSGDEDLRYIKIEPYSGMRPSMRLNSYSSDPQERIIVKELLVFLGEVEKKSSENREFQRVKALKKDMSLFNKS